MSGRGTLQQRILDVLETIDRPGTFCAAGRLPPILPGLEVAGVGPIALPLGVRQAAALKKRARQAPYGKGTETRVDTNVRRVWEIDADQVTLVNSEWPGALAQAVRAVQTKLGLEKQKLEAHLYKLLLYEPGSFFLAHRDGEKLDRMVATLVVALPAVHEGGELVVRHEGREETIDFGPESRFHTQFAAFYADCEHEVRPVKSGFRLALVHNLTLAKSKKVITAPSTREPIEAVARLLGEWNAQGRLAGSPAKAKVKAKAGATVDATGPEEGTQTKLAVLLDHKYTQAGLAYDVLKGLDRARALVLFEAARQAGFDASLALATYWQSGAAEDEDYGYGRRSRWGRYEEEAKDVGRHEMLEVYDHSLTVEHFRDADGRPLAFGQLPLAEEEVVPADSLTKGAPDREEYEGYTGNEGMTLEHWYHHAAVVLWPTGARFDVLCEAGVEAAVGGLAQSVQRWKTAPKRERPPLEQSCLEFADRIISRWPTRKFALLMSRRKDDGTTDLLPLLTELGDASRVAAWLRQALAKDASIDPGKELGDVLQQFGWLTFQDELRSLFEQTDNETIVRQARLLADWALRLDRKAERRRLCEELAPVLMTAVEGWDARKSRRNWEARMVDGKELLPPLIQGFVASAQFDLLERLATYVLARPKVFDLTTVQVPVLLELKDWLRRRGKPPCPPLRRWLGAVVAELEERAANPPQPPADWRRNSATSCTCDDCAELSRFLKDPTLQTLRLPLAKVRRQHLHQIIDDKKLDTTHVTERRGSPYILVLTKTQESYNVAFKAHQVDLEQLAKIREIVRWHDRRG